MKALARKEGLQGSGEYFHKTGIYNSVKILTGGFSLTPVLINESESIFGSSQTRYKFFLSMARSMTSAYFHYLDNSAVLVLSKDAIQKRYKVIPVDYYEGMWIRARNAGSKEQMNTRETEDRLFYKSAVIPATPLIKEVHFHFMSNRADLCVRLMVMAKKLGIPVFAHKDVKTLRKLSKNKNDMVSLDFIRQSTIKARESYRGVEWFSAQSDRLFAMIINIYNASKYSELSKESIKQFLHYRFYADDVMNGIRASMHNSGRRHDRQKRQLIKIIEIMKREKLKNVKELYTFIADKFDRLRSRKEESASAMKALYPKNLKMKDNVTFRRPSGHSEVLKQGALTSLLTYDGRYFVQLRSGRDKYFIEIDKKTYDTISRAAVPAKGTSPVVPSHLPNASEADTAAFIEELAKSKTKAKNPELWQTALDKARTKFGRHLDKRAKNWAKKWYKAQGGKFITVKPQQVDLEEDYNWVSGDIHHASSPTIDESAKQFFRKHPKAKAAFDKLCKDFQIRKAYASDDDEEMNGLNNGEEVVVAWANKGEFYIFDDGHVSDDSQ